MTPAEKKAMAALVDRLYYTRLQEARCIQEDRSICSKLGAVGPGTYKGNVAIAEVVGNGEIKVHEK